MVILEVGTEGKRPEAGMEETATMGEETRNFNLSEIVQSEQQKPLIFVVKRLFDHSCIMCNAAKFTNAFSVPCTKPNAARKSSRIPLHRQWDTIFINLVHNKQIPIERFPRK